jgi:hypothetical protein
MRTAVAQAEALCKLPMTPIQSEAQLVSCCAVCCVLLVGCRGVVHSCFPTGGLSLPSPKLLRR